MSSSCLPESKKMSPKKWTKNDNFCLKSNLVENGGDIERLRAHTDEHHGAGKKKRGNTLEVSLESWVGGFLCSYPPLRSLAMQVVVDDTTPVHCA